MAEGVCMASRLGCCLWILYASSLSPACVFDPSRTKTPRKKENNEKKSSSQKNLNSRSRTVRTQKWTTRADYWTPTEAMCMASRHRPLFMDVVGLNPLSSGMRFLLVSRELHAKQPQKKEAVKKSRLRSPSTPEHVCGPCALRTGRCALFLGRL